MRIHTTLTPVVVRECLDAVNALTREISTDVAPRSAREDYRPHTVTPARFDALDVHGSRTHPRGIEVKLTGDATNRPNSGARGADRWDDAYAASYDQWGLFLAEIYARDESARVPLIYHNGDHFHWATGDRYRREIWTPSDYHRRHKWESHGTAATGSYYVSGCAADDCSAITRRVAHGRTWADISGCAL
ncbi:hypothetical protein SEA_BIPAUNETO_86 [Gordonia phage BiPauneto]|nr:hypothetical protein SEA_BIPAUNETO_86 [Gordonia phage BiPauneto]